MKRKRGRTSSVADAAKSQRQSKQLFYKAIASSDVDGVTRALTAAPSLIGSLSLKQTPPLYEALQGRDPSTTMITLLISKGANVEFLDSMGRSIFMNACMKGVSADVLDLLVQSWPTAFDWTQTDCEDQTALLLACKAMQVKVVFYLLQHVATLSLKEKNKVWLVLGNLPMSLMKDAEQLVVQLLASPIGRDLFEFASSPDVEIKFLEIEELFLGSGPIKILRSTAKMIFYAVTNQWTRVIEAMEEIKPHVVRPIVFACINDSSIDGFVEVNAPEAIHAVSKRFESDCQWYQVRDLFLVQARSQNQTNESSRTKSLGDLPDCCFRNVAAFFQEHFDTESMMELITQESCCAEQLILEFCACDDESDSSEDFFEDPWDYDGFYDQYNSDSSENTEYDFPF